MKKKNWLLKKIIKKPMHIKHMYIFWSDELLELSRQNLKSLDNIYYIYQIRGWIYTYCNEKENLPSISVISGIFFFWQSMAMEITITTRKTGYCGGPETPQKPKKVPLKVHLTYSGGGYCGGLSRQCCSAAIG